MATFMVVGAHPDDAELGAGGTIKKLTTEGHHVVLVDCTAGELGTRGTPELRLKEAANSAAILGVAAREPLGMPDGFVMYSQENVLALVSAMRAHKPAIVLAPPPAERHPDHEAVHKLTRSAAFLAGLPKVVTERNGEPQEPHRPRRILCYMQTYDLPRHPDVYVDISTTWPDKLAALRAFASQFHVPGAYSSNEPHTSLSRPDFLDEMEARARYHGSRIRVAYAEAFLAVEPLGLSSLAHLL